jgi:hypothetical protein
VRSLVDHDAPLRYFSISVGTDYTLQCKDNEGGR